MPTMLSHPAAVLGLHRWFRRNALTAPLIVAGVIGSILPDADVIGFRYGVPYGSTFGHRGFTHSIAFALIASLLLLAVIHPPRKLPAFAFLFLCTMSHGLFDAFTDGGRGVAFFSPFSNHRYFFPWRPIHVSPIGTASMARLLPVFASEAKWVWLPMLLMAIVSPMRWRRSSNTAPQAAAAGRSSRAANTTPE